MRVAVLAGGWSPEREVSLRSGHRVQLALSGAGHEAVLVDPATVPIPRAVQELRPEVCYIALHGKEGEDGTVQSLLEVLGVPYTGSDPLACQLAFDKSLAKEVLARAGVPTPPWVTLQAAALRDLGAGAVLDLVAERVGLPAVVKPTRGGSAMGLSFVEASRDLPGAVMKGLAFADAVVVERKVEGTELAVSTVGDPPEALPAVEVVPKGGVFDYEARYTPGATDYYVPARLPPEVAAACAEVSLRAFAALGLRDVARVDLMVDGQGRPSVIEVNVSPGMTETSLLPMAAGAAGLTLSELCERVAGLALARAAGP
ncbi:MAG TPA: D-alanine--D-alanine ligase [Actinomycetota bacterium]|nr:D-alanine--D-alanine ligase [Actinomycetota bacterium]